MGSRGHTWFHRILEVFKVTCAIRIKTVRDVVREVGHRSAVSGNAPRNEVSIHARYATNPPAIGSRRLPEVISLLYPMVKG